MKYQPKVSTTQKHSDNQGDHIVHEGKLLYLSGDCIPVLNELNDIRDIVKPIIVSEKEEIEVGDWVYNSKSKEIYQITEKPFVEYEHKILALPEHFSDKHLQAIVDGKMKDGDKILLKCAKYAPQSNGELSDGIITHEISLDDRFNTLTVIYLNQQNHITLFPAKQSLEEFIKDWLDNNKPYQIEGDYTYEAMKATAKWIVKNNYKGE